MPVNRKETQGAMVENTEKEYWVGFDLGGTKMLCVVFDNDFQIIGRSRRKTKGHQGMTAGLTRINENIYAAIEDAGINSDAIKGIGIGCPGPLDFKKGLIREAPNLGWQNIPIKDSIESEFDCPAVIANDVDATVVTDMAHIAGLVATGVHPSPVPYSDFVTTTTHKTLRGPRGGLILCREEHKKNINH